MPAALAVVGETTAGEVDGLVADEVELQAAVKNAIATADTKARCITQIGRAGRYSRSMADILPDVWAP